MTDKPAKVYCVSSLEQARVLADPLRLRVLREMVAAPSTTKQVAGRLGEKPTRLYHHVQALEKAGLIRLVETKPVRGTVEKYFQAVASRFEVDSSLFFPESGEGTTGHAASAAIDSILERTRAGLLACEGLEGEGGADEELHSVVAHLTGSMSLEHYREFRERLLAWIEEFSAERAEGPGRKLEFAATLALYPLDVGRAEGGREGEGAE